jgi:DedD protein
MGLEAMFKANKQGKQEPTSSDMDDGAYRSRSEEETASASARKATKRSTKKALNDDPLLPEKKRARRRLIGALALVMAAVIGLPMIFDSEPKSNTNKIAIEIPSKDQALDSQAQNQELNQDLNASNNRRILPVQQSIDNTEEIVQTVPAQVATVPNTPPKTAATNSVAVENKVTTKPEVKVEAKPEKKLEAKLEVKSSTSSATPLQTTASDNKIEAARALALLEGRPAPAAEKKPEATTNIPQAPAGSFAIQVAAFSTKEKIRDLQNQLKAAQITSYTQKIITKNGEVTRIRVGPFANKAEAEKMRAKLVKLGLNGSLIPQ